MGAHTHALSHTRTHMHIHKHIFICLSTQLTQHQVHTNDKSTLSLSRAETHSCRDSQKTHTSTTHILITRSPMSIWALKDCGCWARQRPHREKERDGERKRGRGTETVRERGKSNGAMHSGSYSCWFPRWVHRLIYLNNTFQTGQRGHRGRAGWVCVCVGGWVIACYCPLCALKCLWFLCEWEKVLRWVCIRVRLKRQIVVTDSEERS